MIEGSNIRDLETEKKKYSLLFICLSLLLLSVLGLFIGWNLINDAPSEVIGRSTTGTVSLCSDDPPVLEINTSWKSKQGFRFYKNISRNVTDDSQGLTERYYFESEDIENPDFGIDENTGVIDFVPSEADSGMHNLVLCVTHDVCEGIDTCENIEFNISINHNPVWNETIPDFTVNETEIFDSEPDLIYNTESGNYSSNISFGDYAYDPDEEELFFTSFLIGETFEEDFPAFNLELSGLAEVIDPDDEDVGEHMLTVDAQDSEGNINTSNMFSVEVLNVIDDAPIIQPISDQYLCEDSEYRYSIVAEDPDPDEDINEYIANTVWDYFEMNTLTGEIAFTPNISSLGHYEVNISAIDYNNTPPGEGRNGSSDTISVNYTVFEVNDYPEFTVSSLAFSNGTEGQSYYFDINATDEEDINDTTGNLTFKCSIPWMNDSMNHTTGVINTTIPWNSSHIKTLEICVKDSGAKLSEQSNISCNDDGSPKETCTIASIYIGNNSPVIIESWEPVNTTVTIRETDSQKFTVVFNDLDNGSVNSFWYINEEFKGNEIFVPNSPYPPAEYIFTTGYESSGVYDIEVILTDGGSVASRNWELIVQNMPEPGSSSGGGGGSPKICDELWTCTKWTSCMNLTRDITYPIRGKLLEDCRESDVPEGYCGYRTRRCTDKNNCGTNFTVPKQISGCFYTPDPTCYDGIRNCHGGSCEVLVDCGGPCKPCPTCSDGVMNQNEKGIDCGGPCRPCRVEEKAQPLECGNNICTPSELLSCYTDCWVVWITLLIILITLLGFKKGLDKIRELSTSRYETETIKKLNSLCEAMEKAIDSKDIELAKSLYTKSRKIFKELPSKDKIELYPKFAKSWKKLNNYDKKKNDKK